jgi:carbon-monoxide dehydrogenase large subunit
MSWVETDTAALGDPISRTEDERLLRGTGRFVDDLLPTGVLQTFFVRSPHAHAEIKKINKIQAIEAPGVAMIITGDDLDADGVGNLQCLSFPKTEPEGAFCPERPLLAQNKARFFGEGVAMIIAETLDQAKDAAELIEIEYVPLPSVTLVDAHKIDSSQVWEQAKGNTAFSIYSGDETSVRRLFDTAAHVSRLRISYPRVTANTLEPRSSIAWSDPLDGRFTLCVSSQEPWGVKEAAVDILGISSHDLRVTTLDIGGGFGMKGQVYPEDLLVLWTAKKIGRPIKWTAERSESIATDTHGRGPISDAELALDSDGKILAFRTHVDVDVGAYLTGWAAVPPRNAAISYPGMYHVPEIFSATRATYTNTVFLGPYRGSGKPEASFLLERLVEQAAREMQLDPIAVRRANLITSESMPYHTPGGYVYDSGSFENALDKVLEISDWDNFESRRQETIRPGVRRGIGLSLHCQRAGTFSERMEIRIDVEGMAALYVGTQATGQGHETMFAQMVSGWLGIPLAKIRVFQGDTDRVLFGRGTFAQRSMVTGGSALKAASEVIVKKGQKFAALILEAAETDIEFEEGSFKVSGTDRAVSLSEVAAFSYQGSGVPPELGIGLDGIGTFEGIFSFPNGCMVAEVEVDIETGSVSVEKLYAVDDIGRPVNPKSAHGQLHGSVAMGIGESLVEEIIYDRNSGQLLTGSFLDYGMPRADIMPDIISEFTNDPARTNPLGVKGGSEAGNCGVPAAVFHAIRDAMGRHELKDFDFPATPERIWHAFIR